MSKSNQQVVVITGATAGIGRHAAEYLSARGYRVIATGRNPAILAEIAHKSGGKVDTVRLDVTSEESIAAAVLEVDRLTEGHGADVLVNNAGYGMAAPLAELTDADLRKQFDTNVFGLMAVTRAFLPRMMQRRAGRIINISSIGGRITFPMFGAYHGSKYAVEALSDCLRMELRPFGIRVSLVEPGPIATEFANRSMAEVSKYKNQGTESPYGPVYARADRLKELSDKQAAHPIKVSRAIERAAFGRWPSARYVVPFSSAVMLWVLSRLPTSWRDAMMRRFVGLTAKLVRPVQPVAVGVGAANGKRSVAA